MRLAEGGCDDEFGSGGRGIDCFQLRGMKWNIGGTDEVGDDSRSDVVNEVDEKL